MKNLVRIALIFALSSCCNAGKKSPPSGETTAASSTASSIPASGPVAPAVAKRDFSERPEKNAAAKDILETYKNNEVRADGEYKDKRVQISGKVGDVKKDVTDNIYVTVGTGAQFEIPVVQCFVKSGEEKAAAALNKGDDVTVMGHVDGLMMNVLVKDCVINPHLRLCEKFRPSLGDIKCEASELGASMVMSDGTELAPICVASKEHYDRVANKIMGSTDNKVTMLRSEQALCFLVIAHEKKVISPDLIAKAQKALDSL